MSSTLRRYEFLLPRRFNDSQPVPRFGAVSSELQGIRGQWRHEGQGYRDELIRVFVDVADTTEHREFFVAYKETLKARFRQLDIWMTTYLIEVI
jgi:hypothetical protein